MGRVDNYNYVVTDYNGIKHTHYDRSYALKWYENFGVKLEIETKDLFPKKEVILDQPNFALERIREDLTLKQTTTARRKANEKYDKINTKMYCMKLNLNTDLDVINFLDELPKGKGGKQELLKNLIKVYIKNKDLIDDLISKLRA